MLESFKSQVSMESTLQSKILSIYYAISTLSWFYLAYTLIRLHLYGREALFEESILVLTVSQSLGSIELICSGFGVTKRPSLNTIYRYISRWFIIIGVFYVLPDSSANTSWAYFTFNMVEALREVSRYGLCINNLNSQSNIPTRLNWLRSFAFYVLGPVAVVSQVSIIYLSFEEAHRAVGYWYSWLLIIWQANYCTVYFFVFLDEVELALLRKLLQPTASLKSDTEVAVEEKMNKVTEMV